LNSSKVFLAQTDTTVGFLSSNDKKLSLIKQRDTNQKTLQVVDSFKTLKQFVRVPKKFRNKVRKSKKTTFIYPNALGFRVIDSSSSHHNFIKKSNFLYSTSANLTKQSFNEEFAVNSADVIVYTKQNFSSMNSSLIYKVNGRKLKRIR